MISIHAPREGSDKFTLTAPSTRTAFLSTLPARGATHARQYRQIIEQISIHAPREGSDRENILNWLQMLKISIHAPREGSDDVLQSPYLTVYHFYPRSPRGERRPTRRRGCKRRS